MIQAQGVMKVTITFSCNPCKDSGWISAVKKTTNQQFAFRCGVCKQSEFKKLSLNIPMWTSHFKFDYETYDAYMESGRWKRVEILEGVSA